MNRRKKTEEEGRRFGSNKYVFDLLLAPYTDRHTAPAINTNTHLKFSTAARSAALANTGRAPHYDDSEERTMSPPPISLCGKVDHTLPTAVRARSESRRRCPRSGARLFCAKQRGQEAKVARAPPHRRGAPPRGCDERFNARN